MLTTLEPNERVVLEVRRHPMVLASPILLCVFALTVFFIVRAVPYMPEALGRLVSEPLLDGLLVLIALVLAANLLYSVLAWQKYLWVITNLRVIAERGVVTRSVEECALDKINNISYRQSPAGRVFGYGDVAIQTAAEMGATRINYVISPRLLRDAISKCQEELRSARASLQTHVPAAPIEAGPASPVAAGAAANETKECPFCAERIKAKAKVCRFCGRDLPETQQA